MTRRTSTLSTRVTRLTGVALPCLLVALALGACASHAARCDGALGPINASAPAAQPTPAERPARGASAGHDPGEP